MKFLSSQISYFFSEPGTRENISALLKYLVLLILIIVLYSVLFHVIMLYAEGRYHSWITGVYWTLTVMTTLGFGDITFASDIGRFFSIIVLLSGIVLLLILLPFMFIRLFYAPWLEAQVRFRAPREAQADANGHVIICTYDTIAPGLIERLLLHEIPYYVFESDPAKAALMHGDGISVIAGDVDSSATYRKLRVTKARLVFANCSDTVNTNIILTVREVAPEVPHRRQCRGEGFYRHPGTERLQRRGTAASPARRAPGRARQCRPCAEPRCRQYPRIKNRRFRGA
jgi:voltage-gated potassium channel